MLEAPAVHAIDNVSRVTVPFCEQVRFIGTLISPVPMSMNVLRTFERLPLVGLASTAKVAV